MSRYVHFASRLTGWNAIKSRAEQLGLQMTDEQIKAVTLKIKAMADVRPLAIDDADSIIRTYHHNLSAKQEKPLLELSAEEKKKFVKAEQELNAESEKKDLERKADEQADVPAAKKQKTEAVA